VPQHEDEQNKLNYNILAWRSAEAYPMSNSFSYCMPTLSFTTIISCQGHYKYYKQSACAHSQSRIKSSPFLDSIEITSRLFAHSYSVMFGFRDKRWVVWQAVGSAMRTLASGLSGIFGWPYSATSKVCTKLKTTPYHYFPYYIQFANHL